MLLLFRTDIFVFIGILVSDHFVARFPQVKKPVLEGTFVSIFSVCWLVYYHK